jgi:xanthine dehydrogenase YagT iron-sulfur-binding subunit
VCFEDSDSNNFGVNDSIGRGATDASSQRAQVNDPAHDSTVSRRQFVSLVGAVTGGMALRLPDMNNSSAAAQGSPAGLQEAQAATVVPLQLRINGRMQKWSIDPRVTLLDLLRENAGLTGTKKGCDHGQCGACTVLVNGIRINSCLSLAVTHDGDEVTTIEGLAQDGQLHPVQAAFMEYDGFQCGYCTPGQICSAVALLKEAEKGDASAVTEDLGKTGPADLNINELRERMSGNICRCGAYPGILQALQAQLRPTGEPTGNSG